MAPLRRAVDRDSPDQLALEIKTVPSDDDLYSFRIANNIAENLERAGIRADVAPTRRANFFRDILINLDFDLYVGRHPGQSDPDFLRPFLHSAFAEEPGWQNPFSLSNTVIDEYLETQLRDRADRGDVLADLQETIAAETPFVPIAFEEEQRLIRSDRLQNRLTGVPGDDPLWILQLGAVGDEDDDEAASYTIGTIDGRMTHNLNPLAVEYRGPWLDPVELIYDPLVRRLREEYIPWLATSWEWLSPTGARAPTLEVILREDLTWQDESQLTAHDIVFTYRFLSDTSLDEETDPTIPAPRFRGRTTLVDTAEAVDDRTIRLQFVETSRELAMQLLTVPILPEHVWSELSDLTEVAGIPISDVTTDALVEDNLDPVGSGPYTVTDVAPDDTLELTTRPDHFLFRDAETREEPYRSLGRPHIRELTFDIRPSVSNIAQAIEDGVLDATACNVGREARTSAEDTDDVEGVTWSTTRLVHLGMNLRSAPFTIHGFRDAIGRLVDRTFVSEHVFDGHARPTIAPVYNTSHVPASLHWDSEDPSFVGEPGTGEVDEERIRDLFRDAGFQYTEDGVLLAR